MTISNIPDERKEVAIFLLALLEAVLNEQVKIKLISHDGAKYILDAVRDQAYRMGWIDWHNKYDSEQQYHNSPYNLYYDH